jgi:hypothetical protein
MAPSNKQMTSALRLIMKMNERGLQLIDSHENSIKGTSDIYYTLTFSNGFEYVCFCIDTTGFPEANRKDFDNV